MILLLQCATNSDHCIHVDNVRARERIGQHVATSYHRDGIVQARVGNRWRVLVDCKLPFRVPFYYTDAELTALRKAYQPAEAKAA